MSPILPSSSPNSFVFKWRMPAAWHGSGMAAVHCPVGVHGSAKLNYPRLLPQNFGTIFQEVKSHAILVNTDFNFAWLCMWKGLEGGGDWNEKGCRNLIWNFLLRWHSSSPSLLLTYSLPGTANPDDLFFLSLLRV